MEGELDKHDWEGNPLNPETDTDPAILVWVLNPSLETGFDETWIRDYHRMTSYVEDRFHLAIDDLTEAELREHGFKLNVKLMRVSREQYEELRTVDE